MLTGIGGVVFFLLAALTLAGAAIVAFSQNIVRSAFALLATFIGVAGLYATLSADFVAVLQVLIYVGGILILILFAVMLTTRIADVRVSNASFGVVPGALLMIAVATLLIVAALMTPWNAQTLMKPSPMTASVGNALLGPYVLPFEAISILLFAALIGAVTLARGREKRSGGISNAPKGGGR